MKQDKIVVKKNSLGYIVYNDTTKDGIDLFPNTNEGKRDLIRFVKEMYDQDVSDMFQE